MKEGNDQDDQRLKVQMSIALIY